jgi:hypothetical protein
MSILLIFVDEKAELPMLVTVLGISTDVNPLYQKT